ncbi:MAG: hypothetical protein AAF957_09725 [Planctomycetota bacterium]
MSPTPVFPPVPRSVVSFLVAAACLASASSAQVPDSDVRVLLKSGDLLSSGDTVHTLFTPSIAEGGRWAVKGSVNGDPQQSALFINGELAIKRGDVAPGGGTLLSIGTVRVSRDGAVAVSYFVEDPLSPSNVLTRLQIDATAVLEEGDTVDFPVLGVSGTLTEIFGFDYDAPMLSASVVVAQPGGPAVRLLFTARVTGDTLDVLSGIVEGDPVPGAGAGAIYTIPGSDIQTLDQAGACHAFRFADGGQLEHGVYGFGQAVAAHAQPGPAPNSQWNFDRPAAVRINASNQVLTSGQLTLSSGADRGVVYLDGTPIAVEGGGLNGVLGGIVGDFHSAPIALGEDGTPFFSVPLTTPGTQLLMAGDEVLLRTGATGTQVAGTTLNSLFATVQGPSFDVTPDGRTIIQRSRLTTGESAILLVERGVGDPVTCAAEPNSTGMTGRLDAAGSRFLFVNDLSIVASQLPQDSFGYLNVSDSSTFVAMPGGSSGNLCIGPTVGRFVGQVQSSGSAGEITTTVDLLSIPQPTGFVASDPGDTWYYQLWHRDASPAGATSNFTEALSVTVQ